MYNSLLRKIIIAVSTVLIVLLLFSAVAMWFIVPQLNSLFKRVERPAYSDYIIYDDYAASYPRTKFMLESGRNSINCWLYGAGKTDGIVIICPGFNEGGDSMLAEMMRFVNAGYQVITFDPTGVWSSEGDSIVGLTQEYLDLDTVLDYVESCDEYEDFSVYLYGFSSGGYAAAAMLGSEHYISAAVSVSGFDTPNGIVDEWTQTSLGLLSGRIARPYIALYNFLKFGTSSNISASKAISSCDTPILIAHGTNDGTVSFGRSSILSHQGEITNPNAVFITCDNVLQNDHGTVFLSRGSVEARMKKQQELNALKNQYGGILPADVEKEYYDGVDYERLNYLDDEFMQRVVDFFKNNRRETDFIKQLLE